MTSFKIAANVHIIVIFRCDGGGGERLSVSPPQTLFRTRQGCLVSLLKTASTLKQSSVRAGLQGARSCREDNTNSITASILRWTRTIAQIFLHPLSSVPGRFIILGGELRECLGPAQAWTQPSCVRMASEILSSVKPKLVCADHTWLPLHLSTLFYLQDVLPGNELFSFNRFFFFPQREISSIYSLSETLNFLAKMLHHRYPQMLLVNVISSLVFLE